jgi:hypothetical protein
VKYAVNRRNFIEKRYDSAGRLLQQTERALP